MDHERVNISRSQISCGVMELHRIGDDTEDVLYAIASRLYHPSRGYPCAFFIFSDVDEESASSRLFGKVQLLKIGTITVSPRSENPQTGNVIIVYTWLIDHERFKTWYSAKRISKLGKVGS